MKKIFQIITQFIGRLMQKDPPAPPPKPLTLSEKAYAIALNEVGVKEIPGTGNSPRVIEYHQATDLKATDDDIPWCSAFANWCMQQAGGKGTHDAMARSWLHWGKAVDEPKTGDIVVFLRGTDKVSGHVAFFVKEIPHSDSIQVVGGNQMDMVCVMNYGRSRVLGYRRSLDG